MLIPVIPTKYINIYIYNKNEMLKCNNCFQDILVFVNGNQPITIAGSAEEPAVIVSLLSVDGINEIDNKLHSAALFSLITKYLKINENR